MEITDLAWSQTGLPPHAKLILLAIARNAVFGCAEMYVAQIADMTGISRRSVSRHLRTLESHNKIVTTPRPNQPSVYRLTA